MRHTAVGSLRTDRGNRSPHISPAASSTASVEHPTRHLSSTRPSSPSLPCKLGLRSPRFWPCPGKGQRAFQPTPLFSTPESRPSTRFIGLCCGGSGYHRCAIFLRASRLPSLLRGTSSWPSRSLRRCSPVLLSISLRSPLV